MNAPKLNRVDVSRRNLKDPGIHWLLSNGYRFKVIRNRVFLERPC